MVLSYLLQRSAVFILTPICGITYALKCKRNNNVYGGWCGVYPIQLYVVAE